MFETINRKMIHALLCAMHIIYLVSLVKQVMCIIYDKYKCYFPLVVGAKLFPILNIIHIL